MVLVRGARGRHRPAPGWTYGPAAARTRRRRRARRRGARPGRAGRRRLRSTPWSQAVRNAGRRGAVGYAISAVDVALWDLKARLLELPLHRLLGAVRDDVPVYGSGGFTTYDDRPAARPARRLGARAADPPGQDQDRRVLGHRRRPATSSGCARPGRSIGAGRRAVRRRQRRLHPQAGHPGDAAAATTWTSAGSRSRSPPTTWPGCARSATPCRADVAAGEYGYDLVLLPPHVRGRRGGLPAGRRLPVRRHHRVAARRGRGGRRTGWRSRGTAPRTCTPTSPRRPRTCGTWSGSTTTSASSDCSSTARSTRPAASSDRLRMLPGTG